MHSFIVANSVAGCIGRLIFITSIFFLFVHTFETGKTVGSSLESRNPQLSAQLTSRTILAPQTASITANNGNEILASASRPLVKRGGAKWSKADEERLLRLRREGKSWHELMSSFEGRTWIALSQKYDKLTHNRSNRKRGAKKKKWTVEEDESLLKHVAAGESWEAIAEKLPGRTAQATYHRHRKLTGALQAPKAVWKSYTREEDERIIRAINSGRPVKQVSEMMDRNERSVRDRISLLRDAGRLDTSLSFRKPYTDDELELIHEKRQRGMKFKDIARIYFPGRSLSSVASRYHQYLKAMERE